MPKSKTKIGIILNLLKPQGNPEKLPTKLIGWLLSSGRYIFVLVEALVLIAFGARFKLDADLQSKKEAIEEQIPYIESLKPYEILIRQTQLKLSTIDSARKTSLDWPAVIKRVADQTPISVKISGINIKKDVGSGNIRISGQSPNGKELTSFITGLKGDNAFTNVNLESVGVEQDVIAFTLSISAKLMTLEEKSL
ncbi:PilN domain-containing protein [Candidatus Daviesbacteria bacterium]|nr:PilN domain-containing protein [Candidatus Daviesbacteria bacterium]